MMRRHRLAIAAAALLATSCLAGGARADQKDKRLPGLFDQLKQAADAETAKSVESAIWAIWVEAGDTATDALMAAAQAAMAAEQFPDALKALDRVVAQRPDFAEGWNRRATLYYLMGEYQKSLDDIDRTLKLEPRHFGALSGLGLVDIKLERMEDAASAYQRVLDIDPQSEGARDTLDMINTALKRKSI